MKQIKISRYIFVLTFILLLGVISQSCKSPAKVIVPPSGNPPLDISGSWILTTFDGQSVLDMFKTELPTLNIDQYNHSVSGNSGCNSFDGMFTFDNGVFTAPNLISTLMACLNPNIEDEYQAMLGKESIVKINNKIMTFIQDGKVIAKFQKGIDQTLLYGNWILSQLNGKEASTYFKTGEMPSMQFSVQDQSLSGFAGCNRYSSTYVIDGESINIGPIVTTRMACEDMAGESLFIQILSDTSTISVNRQSITLSKGGVVVAVFNRA